MEQKRLLIFLFIGIIAYYIYSTNKIDTIINFAKSNWISIGLGLIIIYMLFRSKINEYFLNLCAGDIRQFRLILCNINDKTIKEDKIIFQTNDTIANTIRNRIITVDPRLKQIVTGNDPIIAGLEKEALEQLIHCESDALCRKDTTCDDRNKFFDCNGKYPSFIDRDKGKIRPFTLKIDPELRYTYNVSLLNIDKDIIDNTLAQVNIGELSRKANRPGIIRMAMRFNITNNFLQDLNNTINNSRRIPVNSIIMPVTNNSNDLLLGLFNIIRQNNRIISISLIKTFPVNTMLKITFPKAVVEQAKEKEMEEQKLIQSGEKPVTKPNTSTPPPKTNLELLIDELGIKIEEMMYMLPFMFTKVSIPTPEQSPTSETTPTPTPANS